MLVYQTKPLGIEHNIQANVSFCGVKLTWPREWKRSIMCSWVQKD